MLDLSLLYISSLISSFVFLFHYQFKQKNFRFPLWIHKNKNQQKKSHRLKKMTTNAPLSLWMCQWYFWPFSLIQSTPNSYFYLVLVSPLVFLHVYFSSWRKKMAFYGEFFVNSHVTVLSLKKKFQNSSRISVYPIWRELKTKQLGFRYFLKWQNLKALRCDVNISLYPRNCRLVLAHLINDSSVLCHNLFFKKDFSSWTSF